MKKLVLLFVMLFFLFSCHKEKKDSFYQETIIGQWTYVKEEWYMNGELLYIPRKSAVNPCFNDDGSVKIIFEPFYEIATYMITDGFIYSPPVEHGHIVLSLFPLNTVRHSAKIIVLDEHELVLECSLNPPDEELAMYYGPNEDQAKVLTVDKEVFYYKR